MCSDSTLERYYVYRRFKSVYSDSNYERSNSA